jgi:hypothetical protein
MRIAHRNYEKAAKVTAAASMQFATRLAAHGERGGATTTTASTARAGRVDDGVLQSFCEAINFIAQSQTKMFTQTENNFARPFELLQQKGLDAAKKARIDYDRSVKLFDDCLSRHCSAKKDALPDDVAQREADLEAASLAMEDARFDYVTVLNDLDVTERFDTIEGLCTVVYSHLQHYKAAHEKLASLETRLKTLLNSVTVRQRIVCVPRFDSELFWQEKREVEVRANGDIMALRPACAM